MILLFLIFLVYKLLLDFFCFFILDGISTDFLIVYNDGRYMLSWLLYVIICLFLSYWLDKEKEFSISQQIIISLFMFSIVPFIALFSGDIISMDCFITNLFFISLFLSIYLFSSRKYSCSKIGVVEYFPLLHIEDYLPKIKKYVFGGIVFISIFSVVFTFFYYMGGSLFLDGFNVYEQRALYAQSSIPILLRYTLGASNIVELIVLIWLLSRKKYFLAVIMLCISYLHFSLGGEKTVLFSIVLGVCFFFLKRIINKKSFLCFFCMAIFGGILSGQLYFFDILEVPWLASFIRRAFFVPSLLNQYYYDYFSVHPFLYWGINRDYSIGLGINNQISYIFLNSPGGFANNGLLGDAYSNAGYIGLFLVSVLLVIICKLFDFSSYGLNKLYCIGVSIYIAFGLLNSVCTTVMVTHGGFIGILLLYCLPRNDDC